MARLGGLGRAWRTYRASRAEGSARGQCSRSLGLPLLAISPTLSHDCGAAADLCEAQHVPRNVQEMIMDVGCLRGWTPPLPWQMSVKNFATACSARSCTISGPEKCIRCLMYPLHSYVGREAWGAVLGSGLKNPKKLCCPPGKDCHHPQSLPFYVT
eukprot:1151315-Pelagomonas_calceolata.AAC.5